MHSHDRTLLARLGFQDPDKKNPRHDLACRYVASSPERFIALAKKLDLELTEANFQLERPVVKGEGQYSTVIGFIDVEAAIGGTREVSTSSNYPGAPSRVMAPFRGHMLIEVKIAREDIGGILRQFALYRSYWHRRITEWDRSNIPEPVPLDGKFPSNEPSYGPERDWWNGYWFAQGRVAHKWWEEIGFDLLFMDWKLSKGEADELRKARIVPVRLGPAFEEFCAQQSEEVGLIEL